MTYLECYTVLPDQVGPVERLKDRMVFGAVVICRHVDQGTVGYLGEGGVCHVGGWWVLAVTLGNRNKLD